MIQFALKKLTASDLSVLASHHGRTGSSNQKAINLNGDVFAQAFFPMLADLADDYRTEIERADRSGAARPPRPRFDVTLDVSGPAGHAPVRSAHHIALYDKNWRLNGAFIRPPAHEASLYDVLEPDDIAILAFEGSPVPTRVALTWVRAFGGGGDAALHGALAIRLGTRSMVPVSASDLRANMTATGLPEDHGAWTLLPDSELERAVEAAVERGAAATIDFITRTRRTISTATLERIQAARVENGRQGEEMVNHHLAGERMLSLEWVSQKQPLAPLDFRITDRATGDQTSIDVKATSGPHERPFHLSMGEAIEAARSPCPYRIFRVAGIADGRATLRRSGDIRDLAQRLISAAAAMPAGTEPEGFVIDPVASGLTWDAAVSVRLPDS